MLEGKQQPIKLVAFLLEQTLLLGERTLQVKVWIKADALDRGKTQIELSVEENLLKPHQILLPIDPIARPTLATWAEQPHLLIVAQGPLGDSAQLGNLLDGVLHIPSNNSYTP
ncbi:hypothetical protein SDC9_110710 [bioreactor metagenome]|uniref:Uncharacterized protein n=1 Tax=bioreactor metagenome TaxID=1076179 RepID=A0A645BFD4_9ZZZZ